MVVVGLVLGGWDVPAFTVQPPVAVPVDPLGGGEFNLGKRSPGPSGLDRLSLGQADRGFHEGVEASPTEPIEATTPAASRCSASRNSYIAIGIGVMCQLTCLMRMFVAVALPQGHVQGVQDEPGLLRQGGGPTDDPAGESVTTKAT